MTAKNSLTIFMAVTFTGMAVFSFLAMGDHGPGHNVGGCIAVFLGETNCSVFGGLVGFASFHLDAFKFFSSADFSAATAMGLAFFIAAFVFYTASAGRLLNFGFSTNTFFPVVAYSAGYGFCTPLEQDFKSWLALHENSPAIFKTLT